MHVVLTLLSVALLFAIVMLVKERRLRLALQNILQRLLQRMRSRENTSSDHLRAQHRGPVGDHRLRR